MCVSLTCVLNFISSSHALIPCPNSTKLIGVWIGAFRGPRIASALMPLIAQLFEGYQYTTLVTSVQ